MKILLDANTPAPLARFLRGHEVVRADEIGVAQPGKRRPVGRGGKGRFDLLLTCDQNVRYQQNFTGRQVSLVVLSSNHWPTLQRVAARIATRVDFAQVGQIIRVDVISL